MPVGHARYSYFLFMIGITIRRTRMPLWLYRWVAPIYQWYSMLKLRRDIRSLMSKDPEHVARLLTAWRWDLSRYQCDDPTEKEIIGLLEDLVEALTEQNNQRTP